MTDKIEQAIDALLNEDWYLGGKDPVEVGHEISFSNEYPLPDDFVEDPKLAAKRNVILNTKRITDVEVMDEFEDDHLPCFNMKANFNGKTIKFCLPWQSPRNRNRYYRGDARLTLNTLHVGIKGAMEDSQVSVAEAKATTKVYTVSWDEVGDLDAADFYGAREIKVPAGLTDKEIVDYAENEDAKFLSDGDESAAEEIVGHHRKYEKDGNVLVLKAQFGSRNKDFAFYVSKNSPEEAVEAMNRGREEYANEEGFIKKENTNVK